MDGGCSFGALKRFPEFRRAAVLLPEIFARKSANPAFIPSALYKDSPASRRPNRMKLYLIAASLSLLTVKLGGVIASRRRRRGNPVFYKKII